VSSIYSIDGSGTRASGSGASGAPGEISAEQFLKILISELQNQNPLEPMKNSELMEQMSAIKNLQAIDALTRQLGKLTEQSKVGEAAPLIGKLVSGTTASGVKVEGVVDRILVENNNVSLVVKGFKVPYANVAEVAEAEEG